MKQKITKLNISQRIFQNKRAFFDYEILEKIEAGLVLKGDEIKAIRAGKTQLRGSFAKIFYSQKVPELYIVGLYLGSENQDAQRTRKLLVHKTEINKLIGKTQEKGLTLIPTRLYFKRGKAKLEIGIARPKKKWDKRQAIKEKEFKRSSKFHR
ncbi:SsrA-binding protein [Candidatus Berkelbacteria bacterium CG_4_9_14_3_um_filter_39_23]|uniref:SsrA-binding protein n=2 Tax=Candidatus Berkelbacteria TaxID=1618330 RepID=A0A2M7CJ86_9BACT|nr:SsrA-binding protein SmpB [Candidatus Berkelbacteria bacterium]OIP04817.1 MAG: SsrA-binding protein [Candidatus Berkelbacteria bacterium CG2_30_39_44]PIR28070.1 MAG: SsrA-binding protein [Candidatus Berkelbacteria bacterium CG11_big_fil_rev_8_21_14_0_20_40_23]PIV25713.1 MAG: SsrA-binding protein [Candidatus Berkelbacteria bacterium CG03_land_8_20_14_0_80_40_36]PIX30546.1 MAG: SsrA-binding protein [Candidatus Berkelbacteria bacterium CG_4_8_14_3_um_filter_39_27]PIZ29100.1 MAG: SsrA-binding p